MRMLQVAGCRLQVAGCRLQVAGCRLQVVTYGSVVFEADYLTDLVKQLKLGVGNETLQGS
jgi:hypothetical protein